MSLATMPLPSRRALRVLKTRAVQKTEQMLNRAAATQTIAMIIAAPGCQKSYSIKSWRRQHADDVPYIYIEADMLTSPRPILNALCDGLGVIPGSLRMTVMRDALVERLAERDAHGKTPLIIVDQADMLTVRALETLRTIWDRVSERLDTDGESAFGLGIFGAPELRTRILRPELERLHRRIAEFGTLPPLDLKELQMALQMKWPQVKIESDDALNTLHEKCRASFGWLNRIMDKSITLAAKADGVLTSAIIRRVADKHLIGLLEAE